MRRALVVVFAAFGVQAQAPENVIVNPVAVCDKGKCVMREKDYRTLVAFHQQKFEQMLEVGDALRAAQEEIAQLRGQLTRFAAGRCGRRT